MHSMETINELREEIMQLTKQISEQVTKLLFTCQVSNGNTRTMWEVWSVTIRTPE